MFLAIEVVGFALAALVHAGVLLEGYQHHEARIAETVIAAVLLFGLIGSLAAPARTRAIGLGVQAFALLGTCVGIFTMIIGVGPQSGFDIALHAGFVTVLIAGLLAARQAGAFGAPA
jgi:hypothetical protein